MFKRTKRSDGKPFLKSFDEMFMTVAKEKTYGWDFQKKSKK